MRIDYHNFTHHNDLVTYDGFITSIKRESETSYIVELLIIDVGAHFAGHTIPKEDIFFNLKSALAQMGMHAITKEIVFHKSAKTCEVKIVLKAHNDLSMKMLPYLEKGAYLGKLFAADRSRRVRQEHYLTRMFGRTNAQGCPPPLSWI